MTRQESVEKAKEVIRENFGEARFGLFFTRNVVGDPMEILYKDENVRVEICFSEGYFEAFGLTEREETELQGFYLRMAAEKRFGGAKK